MNFHKNSKIIFNQVPEYHELSKCHFIVSYFDLSSFNNYILFHNQYNTNTIQNCIILCIGALLIDISYNISKYLDF